jgi:hypothetical protein
MLVACESRFWQIAAARRLVKNHQNIILLYKQNHQNFCSGVKLSENRDRCTWLLEENGIFSVKSMYIALKQKIVCVNLRTFGKLRFL